MNLFDYISSDLPSQQKTQLYQEKSVCLCLFRVIFDQVEQQLIYRIIFMDQNFTIQDIQEMLHIKPKAIPGMNPSPEEMKEAKKQHEDLSEKFIKKLQKFELAVEIETQGMSTPGLGRNPRTPSLQQNVSRQSDIMGGNTPILSQMTSGIYETEKDIQNKRQYKLKPEFQFELTNLIEKKSSSKIQEEEKQQVEKWENQARYIEFDVRISQYQLTVNGFQYILMDTPSQVQNILLNYIQTAQQSGRDVYYKLREKRENILQILSDFKEIGLIGTSSKGSQNLPPLGMSIGRKQKFFITSLLQSFLQSQTGQNLKIVEQSTSLVDQQKQQILDKFIIVETNFKVFAYTSSDLYRQLLKQFIRVECFFPNLVVGTLTRKSLQKAYQRGISSQQILHFLETHTHITARMNKMAQQQSNMSAQTYEYSQSRQATTQGTEDAKNMPIADLFGLSSSRSARLQAANKDSYNYIPPNVRQQIELWEKELKSLSSKPGLLIEFDSKDRYNSFIEYAKQKKILIYKILEKEFQQKKEYLVIVDVQNEKEAYEFTFM
ncbi:tfiih and nucleotide excision repair factor 3 complexes subunit [Stylonychia lemnae]|uniref:General transcription factor IIH subunit 4 n=1 Tax=Stylonychia lemnae TaxID=5949 RepID=A0A077ZY57_STYLE|nr:tfiih and nucleotide excision repair factor 3 complexes subunit [Stylonychia lemnae]|eukprot:CDW73476.1 tfiih and nucleotide excision repair factor 3 complexes subunit [Stylonychia lemnae]